MLKTLKEIGLAFQQGLAKSTMTVVLLTALALMLATDANARSKKQPVAKPQTIEQKRSAIANQLRSYGAQVIILGETIRVVLPSDKLFNKSSANVKNKAFLKVLAQYLNAYRTVDIAVDGYTDNKRLVGRPQNFQQALTAEQARVVIDYLWSRGVDTRLLVAEGQGDRNAVAWNGSEAGQAQNRRIEVSFRFYPEYNSWD